MSAKTAGATIKQLEVIARDVVESIWLFSASEIDPHMTKYHDFEKFRLPEDFLRGIIAERQYAGLDGLTPDMIQLEIAKVTGDLRHQVHRHLRSNAVVIILGGLNPFPLALNARMYYGTGWFSIGSQEVIRIHAGIFHGFTVGKGGILYFLSVQSPPLMKEGEYDDYEKL